MSLGLALPILEAASFRVAERMGLHYPPSKWPDLERAFGRAAKDFGFSGLDECVNWFISEHRKESFATAMAGSLTVGETYCFSEGASFDALEETVLPGL
ncbi:MAG: hypothetical protein Q8N15_04710, partial [Bacillota bacterium]|nr:hypothetical protein [Bacillota bacterium]